MTMLTKSESLLVIEELHTYYGNSHILQCISFNVEAGEVLGLFGRNGVGKTTTVQTIVGLPAPRSGKILVKGKAISGLPTHAIVRHGVGWVPQGRRIFPTLKVEENLNLAAMKGKGGKWPRERIYEQFPILHSRRRNIAENLSGGEQQMLAIARALIQNPVLLLMDEPSEGLAPLLVAEIGKLVTQLKDEGCAVLLVEQNLSFGLPLTQNVLVMNKGQIVFRGRSEMFSKNVQVLRQYLGVAA